MTMRLGKETGSVINHLMSDIGLVEPKVGMGATILCWSDRHAATIVKVTKATIHVRRDKAIRTDKNGMSEIQTYTYEPDPDAPVEVFRKTKRGWRATGGGSSAKSSRLR